MSAAEPPSGAIFLLAGSAVPVSAAIGLAVAQCYPCIVTTGVPADEPHRPG